MLTLAVIAFIRSVVAEPPPTLPISPSLFDQYGPITIVAAVFASLFWIMFRRYEQTLDLERQRSAKAEDEVRELNKIARELMMPALTQATSAITEAMRVLRKEHSG